MKKFKCRECGYIHLGDEAPKICPVCGFDSDIFYEMEEGSVAGEIEYFEMIESLNDTDLKHLRKSFDRTCELAAVSLAMSRQAQFENETDSERIFKDISSELLNHASYYAMMLGEFLEFNTESSRGELKRKLNSELKKTEDFLENMAEYDEEYEKKITKIKDSLLKNISLL